MPKSPTSPVRRFPTTIVLLIATLIGLWILRGLGPVAVPRHVPYSEVFADVQEGKVEEANIRPKEIAVTMKAEAAGKPRETIVAQRIACCAISTGAEDDLERATETARQMVCRFGMSEVLGPATWGRARSMRFLQLPGDLGLERDFSEETSRLVDAEVRRTLDTEHARSRDLLRERRATLDAIAHELLSRETLERTELEAIVREHSSGFPATAAPPARDDRPS